MGFLDERVEPFAERLDLRREVGLGLGRGGQGAPRLAGGVEEEHRGLLSGLGIVIELKNAEHGEGDREDGVGRLGKAGRRARSLLYGVEAADLQRIEAHRRDCKERDRDHADRAERAYSPRPDLHLDSLNAQSCNEAQRG